MEECFGASALYSLGQYGKQDLLNKWICTKMENNIDTKLIIKVI